MITRTEARTAGRRLPARVSALVAVAAVAVGLTACQTPAEGRETISGPSPRPVVAAPADVDGAVSADRIVEELARRAAANAERFRGVPADRIERSLQHEACIDRLLAGDYPYGPAEASYMCASGMPHPVAVD